MKAFMKWWNNDLSKWVKFVFLALLANGLPAFLILMSLPRYTEILFVWTINPVINARLIGVMYSNALLLVAFGAFQTKWANARIVMVVITLFSIFATLLTFVFLKPFLAHPWYHLAYWLTMYFILFFSAPYVFITHEKKYGGKLLIQTPLTGFSRLIIGISTLISLVLSAGLIFRIDLVNQLFPWPLPPLVGGLIGVLFSTHAAAYAWALWDGDWLRTRPIFWQAPITGLLLFLLPLTHATDVRPDAGFGLVLYYLLTGFMVIPYAGIILGYRNVEKEQKHG